MRDGIDPGDPEEAGVLFLSHATAAALRSKTAPYTNPLLDALLDGAGDPSLPPYERLLAAESRMDPAGREVVSRNCRILKERMGAASLMEVADLVDRLGDAFLSAAFYGRFHAAALRPAMSAFAAAAKSVAWTPGGGLGASAPMTEAASLFAAADHRLRRFLDGMERLIGGVWSDPRAGFAAKATFAALASKTQAELGGALVAISLRLDAWTASREVGLLASPQAQDDLVRRRVLPGLDAAVARIEALLAELCLVPSGIEAALPAPTRELELPRAVA